MESNEVLTKEFGSIAYTKLIDTDRVVMRDAVSTSLWHFYFAYAYEGDRRWGDYVFCGFLDADAKYMFLGHAAFSVCIVVYT